MPAKKPTVSRNDLEGIAKFQKGVLLCILAQLGLLAAIAFIPPAQRFFLQIAFGGLSVLSGVLVLLLAMKLYGSAPGIVLGILAMIPCLGLVFLLIVNSKATATLQVNGVKVGLLGARMSDLE